MGAPHAFNADYRPSYRADAAKDAWARMLVFLKQYDVAGTATRAKAG
jgi:carboxymethylenebutenolidase